MTVKKTMLKYINIVNPVDIKLKEEDIFLREKYKEIINYLKLVLSDSKDLEINSYVDLKGSLLINILPGTDILDYLNVISSNFFVKLIQLKESTIIENSSEFFENFFEILSDIDNLLNSKSTDESEEDSVDNKKKKILLIDQTHKLNEIYGDENLLNKFVYYYREKKNLKTLLKNNILLIWINHDYNEIVKNSGEIFEVFDFLIKVPIINKIERIQILKSFMEKNNKITFDIDLITDITENWEVKEIKKLIDIAILRHHLNSELNKKSNEITEIIKNIIELGEFIPSFHKNNYNNHKEKKNGLIKHIYHNNNSNNGSNHSKDVKNLIDNIKSERYSEFMLNQLYENAASENYNHLVIIIDKLFKNEHLEELDRKLLSKYPFILNDPPGKAQISLEKAKKKIDLIKKSFGK
ncbi:MAG: hypothetical protein KGD63_07430 [Candidatus Lokiarchaeota archaeon]|nr:hypothetical protein [Candidatus Lokiarchaeota archaeon]